MYDKLVSSQFFSRPFCHFLLLGTNLNYLYIVKDQLVLKILRNIDEGLTCPTFEIDKDYGLSFFFLPSTRTNLSNTKIN